MINKEDVLKVNDKYILANIEGRTRYLIINRVPIDNGMSLDILCNSCALFDEVKDRDEVISCVIKDRLGFCYLCDIACEVCYFTESTSLILASKYRNDRME